MERKRATEKCKRCGKRGMTPWARDYMYSKCKSKCKTTFYKTCVYCGIMVMREDRPKDMPYQLLHKRNEKLEDVVFNFSDDNYLYCSW